MLSSLSFADSKVSFCSLEPFIARTKLFSVVDAVCSVVCSFRNIDHIVKILCNLVFLPCQIFLIFLRVFALWFFKII